jgi:hypothetical protein
MSIPLTTGIETLKNRGSNSSGATWVLSIATKAQRRKAPVLPMEHSRESGCLPMLAAGFLAGALKSARKLIAVNNPPLARF